LAFFGFMTFDVAAFVTSTWTGFAPGLGHRQPAILATIFAPAGWQNPYVTDVFVPESNPHWS